MREEENVFQNAASPVLTFQTVRQSGFRDLAVIDVLFEQWPQPFYEHFSGPVNTRLDRTHANIEDLGNFCIAQMFILEKKEGCSVVQGQRFDGPLNELVKLRTLQNFIRLQRSAHTKSWHFDLFLLQKVANGFIQDIKPNRSPLALEIVQRMIDCNAIDPRIDLRALLKSLHVLVYFHENILKKIASDVLTRSESEEQIQDALAIFIVDFFERQRTGAFLRL